HRAREPRVRAAPEPRVPAHPDLDSSAVDGGPAFAREVRGGPAGDLHTGTLPPPPRPFLHRPGLPAHTPPLVPGRRGPGADRRRAGTGPSRDLPWGAPLAAPELRRRRLLSHAAARLDVPVD